jgi:hypothetical protein
LAGDITSWTIESDGGYLLRDVRERKTIIGSLDSGELDRIKSALGRACPFDQGPSPTLSSGCADCYEYDLLVESVGLRMRAKFTTGAEVEAELSALVRTLMEMQHHILQEGS